MLQISRQHRLCRTHVRAVSSCPKPNPHKDSWPQRPCRHAANFARGDAKLTALSSWPAGAEQSLGGARRCLSTPPRAEPHDAQKGCCTQRHRACPARCSPRSGWSPVHMQSEGARHVAQSRSRRRFVSTPTRHPRVCWQSQQHCVGWEAAMQANATRGKAPYPQHTPCDREKGNGGGHGTG